MARFKNHLLVVIGFTLAGLTGAAFGTGTAQAVVSTLVTNVNTAANPVPTSSVNVTDPGRIGYQSTQVQTCATGICTFTFPAVPSGHRVVVQHITGEVAEAAVTTTKFMVTAIILPAEPVTNFFVPVFTLDGIAFGGFDQAVLFYVDSGNQVQFFADSSDIGNDILTLTGYEPDCSAAPCAAIAQ